MDTHEIDRLTIEELQRRIDKARALALDIKQHLKSDDTAALLALSVVLAALR